MNNSLSNLLEQCPAIGSSVRANRIQRRGGVSLFALTVLVLAIQAVAATPEYIMSRSTTADVAGQKVELAAGQSVTVLGTSNGTAMIRVTLPNGSLGVAQIPAANLSQKAAPTPALATPAPSVVPQAQQSPSATPIPAPAAQASAVKQGRTKAEVDALIDDAGKKKPDWWDATPLNYPPALDLTWKAAPGDKQKDIGTYIWGFINPNPGKWKEGIKLLQQSINASKGDQAAQKKAAGIIAHIYTEMLGDYARGAFWAKKAGDREILLVTCYMKLGCPSAAIAMLQQMGSDNTRNGQAIKLWAELGDLKTALDWAERLGPSDPTVAYLAAGDACRRFGKIPEALAYYQKVLDVTKQFQRDDPVNKKRAAANIEGIKLFDGLDLAKIDDGSYKADSIGYVGPVEVTVTVKNHGIESVKVTGHHEKQFYSSIVDVPAQIVLKQSVKGIDTTTGATVTSEAIINASAKALSAAQK